MQQHVLVSLGLLSTMLTMCATQLAAHILIEGVLPHAMHAALIAKSTCCQSGTIAEPSSSTSPTASSLKAAAVHSPAVVLEMLAMRCMPDHCLAHGAWLVGSQYKPAEVNKGGWDVVAQSPPWAVDAWGLGCFMQEAFSRRYLQSVENLRCGGAGALGPVRYEVRGEGLRDMSAWSCMLASACVR
eukprot:scaffold255931_cov23-Tisochrysis_lutea.AAC.1